MGANCGCIKEDMECEITIRNDDSDVRERAGLPRKRPNWEEKFNEILNSPPIPSKPVKVLLNV